MAVLGVVLVVLGVLALVGGSGGSRVLLAGVGLGAAVRGAGLMRDARAGRLPRTSAAAGAVAVWLGLVGTAVALLSGALTGWVLTGVLVLAPAAAAVGTRRSGARIAAAGLLLAAASVAVFAGTGVLVAVGAGGSAVLVAALGVANLLGARGMVRLARGVAPAPAGGCGGCVCGAGGCSSQR